MRGVERLAAAPPALALAAYSGLAVMAGAELRYTGAVNLYATAAILGLAAILIALGQLLGRAFALLFFLATTIVYGYVTEELVRAMVTDSGSSDRLLLRRLVYLGMAAVAFAGFAVSITLGYVLARVGWKEGGEGVVAHVLAWPLALAGVGAVAWMVGYQYHYRSLREQNACLSGQSARCSQLAGDQRFSASERLQFAKAGCEGGHTSSCSALAGRLGPAHGASSPEALVLAERCKRGNADVCLRLGEHLLGVVRDREAASLYFSRACETTADRCSQAAKLADARGESAMAERLLQRGCERDDPTSCRTLLRKMERAGATADRDQFHLRVCLITDVNECMPLIRRDAAAFCPVICEGTSENRMQSCDHCGRHSAKVGERALAERWWGGNCERGHALSCVNLGLMYDELGQRNQAAPWFSKACDRARNVTLGCQCLERPSPSKGAALRPSGRAGPRISR